VPTLCAFSLRFETGNPYSMGPRFLIVPVYCSRAGRIPVGKAFEGRWANTELQRTHTGAGSRGWAAELQTVGPTGRVCSRATPTLPDVWSLALTRGPELDSGRQDSRIRCTSKRQQPLTAGSYRRRSAATRQAYRDAWQPTKRSCLGWGMMEPPSRPRGQPSLPSVGGGSPCVSHLTTPVS